MCSGARQASLDLRLLGVRGGFKQRRWRGERRVSSAERNELELARLSVSRSLWRICALSLMMCGRRLPAPAWFQTPASTS
jgi:hypothetical protein